MKKENYPTLSERLEAAKKLSEEERRKDEEAERKRREEEEREQLNKEHRRQKEAKERERERVLQENQRICRDIKSAQQNQKCGQRSLEPVPVHHYPHLHRRRKQQRFGRNDNRCYRLRFIGPRVSSYRNSYLNYRTHTTGERGRGNYTDFRRNLLYRFSHYRNLLPVRIWPRLSEILKLA